jgi:hypothetical protein
MRFEVVRAVLRCIILRGAFCFERQRNPAAEAYFEGGRSFAGLKSSSPC